MPSKSSAMKSLDELVQKNKYHGKGPVRNAPKRRGTRHTPYSKATTGPQHDQTASLHVENLHYGVSTGDLEELFSEVGNLMHCSVHYDRFGRSLGTAEVVFEKKHEALIAKNRYNNLPLDGRPLEIAFEVSRTISDPVAPARPQHVHSFRRGGNKAFEKRPGKAGGGRGSTSKTAEELDAELENYHKQRAPMDLE